MQTRLKMALPDSGVEIVVDSKLDGNYPKKTYEILVDLALKCASFEKNTRPTMKVCAPRKRNTFCGVDILLDIMFHKVEQH